ncbi:hypothetical protein FIBSPDRAFT_954638 [Athelia psychrophila]|uniref:BTB domain-containing protein n=1 Tax=Athelia psychrophila TaxID=1759441 RepID=A0A166IWS8_9AGAM|nr:hypothetical protein FIBSPDRAFT_954638 [Fibularhizoctonia sp. CBS 109695]
MSDLDTFASPTGVKREYHEDYDAYDSSPVTSKRARITSPLTRHPKFWDPYGDVIIRVEKIMFKLQAINLTRQSKYFDRLINCSKETSQHDDGSLPVYHVTTTTAHDFEALLTATDSDALVSYLLKCPPFHVVASILRVSTALNFPKLRDYAVNCLNDVWSDDLEKFSTTSKWLEHSPEAIHLSRRCNVPSIRKRAMYELVRKSGSCETEVHLTKADLVMLSRVKDAINNEWWRYMLREKSNACVKEPSRLSGPPACLGFPAMHLTLPRNAEFLIQRARDPISGYKDASDAPWKAICDSCVEAKRIEWRKERSRIWMMLDGLFELTEGTSVNIVNVKLLLI